MKKVKRTKNKPDEFRVIMDRVQLRNELSALITRYGRDKVSFALALLIQEIVRKAKP